MFQDKIKSLAENAQDMLADKKQDMDDYAGKKRRHEYRGWIAIYWTMLGSALLVWAVWLINLFAPQGWRWLECEDLNTAFKLTAGALGAILYGRAKEGKAKHG